MRNSRRKNRASIMAEINITPFTDVVLVLLIIFMITTPMLMQPGIKVNLPQTQTQEDLEDTSIEVTIPKSGLIVINGTAYNESSVEDAVRNVIAKYPNKPIVIKGDKDVKYDAIIRFMDIARKVGASKFALAADTATAAATPTATVAQK
jgi:biopolymer transport protein ExbD